MSHVNQDKQHNVTHKFHVGVFFFFLFTCVHEFGQLYVIIPLRKNKKKKKNDPMRPRVM